MPIALAASKLIGRADRLIEAAKPCAAARRESSCSKVNGVATIVAATSDEAERAADGAEY